MPEGSENESSTLGQRRPVGLNIDLHCLVLRMQRAPLKIHGGVAQLGEHLLCKQGVRSSILLISTIGTGNGLD